VLFYKVASGLCLYFIASTLWGLAERRFLPKALPDEQTAGVPGKKLALWEKLQKLLNSDGAAGQNARKKKSSDRR